METVRHAALWKEGMLAGCLYFGLTVVLAYPLSVHPGSMALPMGADTNLLLWLIEWDVYGLTHRPLSIFDANIFFPLRHSLAFSENMIGSAVLAAPVLWATRNPVLALNVVALLSCILCGVGTYVLCRRLGIRPGGAVIGGLIFAFAPPRFFRLGQLHLTSVQWIPFGLASLHAYLDGGRRRDLWWACGFFAIQALTSGHGAVFMTIAMGTLLLWRVLLGEPLAPLRRLHDLNVPGVLLLMAGGSVLLPYLTVQQELGLRRGLGEAYLFSPNLASFLSSPTRLHAFMLTQLSKAPMLQEAKAFLFPGYLTLALAFVALFPRRGRPAAPAAGANPWSTVARALEIVLLVSLITAIVITTQGGTRLRFGDVVLLSLRQPWRIWVVCGLLVVLRVLLIGRAPLSFPWHLDTAVEAAMRWRRDHRRSAAAFYGLLSAFTLWLSLGPPFHLYTLVYQWPGFSFIRVPSRFTLLTLLGLAVLAAIGFERLIEGTALRTRRMGTALVVIVMAVEFWAIPLNAIPYQVEIPAADRWLATQARPFAVAELPLGNPEDAAASDQRQSVFMLHSTAHWQKTIHGYSGMLPPLHAATYSELLTFPDDVSLVRLADLEVTYVVVHAGWYLPAEWPAVAARIDQYADWLTLVHTDGTDRVYAFRRPPPEAVLRYRQRTYAVALAHGDAEAIAAFYTIDAVVVRPHGLIVKGRPSIDEWAAAAATEESSAIALEFGDSAVRGGEAQVDGRFQARGPRGTRQQGHFIQTWRRVAGQWQIAYDVYTSE